MKHSYRTTLIFLFILTSLSTSFSQMSFSHGVGGSYYVSENTTATALLYSPRINFLEIGESATLSAGSHLGFGFSFITNTFSGTQSSFVYDIPLMLEFNFGKGANESIDSGFGFFLGAGYGISKVSAPNIFGGTSQNASTGPVANLGFRFNIQDREFALRLSYLLNNSDDSGNSSVFGLGFTYALPGATFGGGGSSSSSSNKSNSSSTKKKRKRRKR